MINKKIIIENFSILEDSLKKRNKIIDLKLLEKLLTENKKLNIKIENLNFQKNNISKDISKLILLKKNDDIEKLKLEVILLKNQLENVNKKIIKNEKKLDDILLSIPNIPNDSVPIGKDESESKVIKYFGKPIKFDFNFKAHWDISVSKNIVDFDRASKITGSRFVIYRGKGSKLIRALQQFTLDMHSKNGFEEFSMPVIVNKDSLYGTGNLPKFEDDLFKLQNTNYYLSPTLEVQLTNYYRNEILQEKKMPYKITSSSINFRSEAGSAGRDTRGVIRQHQFYKTEMVIISNPKESYNYLEEMTRNAEQILEELELPYRRIVLCTGDMGFSSAKTYDIEVWLPSYNDYKEISSCSNCEDFQARRAMIRFKNEESKKNELVHTLNGSGLAIDRLWAAVIENNQTKEGDIIIPKKLLKYLDFNKI